MATQENRRRVAGAGTRRTISPVRANADETTLDDRPLALVAARDGRWIAVALPWEVWLLDARTLTIQRNIELAVESPCIAEASDGIVWIGGSHLHRASIQTGRAEKVGSKLAGFVDRVAVLRPDLLCGVGGQGELLWDTTREAAVHQRKSPHGEILHVVATADERAVFIDGSDTAWIIDPGHASGYTQLRLRESSGTAAREDGFVAVGLSTRGRCLLAARDGAVAWTTPQLRIAGTRFPRVPEGASRPLAIVGDERWIYVLRPGGLLQRLLIEQPPEYTRQEENRARRQTRPDGRGRGRGDWGVREAFGQASARPDEEIAPLPEAQECRLAMPATCMTLVAGDGDDRRLVLGGSKAEGQLGRVWSVDPTALDWRVVGLRSRTPREASPEASASAPTFVATRSKIDGTALASLTVDQVIGGELPFWVTHAHGALLERPVGLRSVDQILPGDALLLPAMLRFRAGTARPALLLWPGLPRDDDSAPEAIWLTWGDQPRRWIPLDTPHIREQRWSRRDVFPLQVALRAPPPKVAGHRATLPKRWVEPALFAALVDECKHQLEVLW